MTEFKSSQQPKCGVAAPDPRDGAARVQNDKHLATTAPRKSSFQIKELRVKYFSTATKWRENFLAERREKSKGEVSKQRRYKSLVSEKSLMKPQCFKGN